MRKDRLTRFGYKYLEELFSAYNVTLHYIEEDKEKSYEEELMQDFMTILSSFTGRYSAMKSKNAKKAFLEKALNKVETQ